MLNGWVFQIDRTRITDFFEEGDLPRLFDESDVICSFSKPEVIHWYYRDWEKLNQLNYGLLNGWVYQIDRSKINDNFEQGDLELLFKEPKSKKRKRTHYKRMSMSTSPLSHYNIFGDPTNLRYRTIETSEEHLLIEPQQNLDRFFERQRGPKKPTEEERERQAQADRERALLQQQ